MRSLHISENSASARTSSLSRRSRSPLKSAAVHRPSSLAPFGDRPPVALNRPIASSRALVSDFMEKVSINFIVLSHFSAWVPPAGAPARRYAPPCTLDAPLGAARERAPDPGLRNGRQPREHSLAKNVLSLWNPNGGSKRCCLAFRLLRREADHSHHAEDGCETAEKIRQDETREMTVLGTILLIILILILIGSLPTWPYSAGWGYYPSSGLGLVVIIILILVLMGRI